LADNIASISSFCNFTASSDDIQIVSRLISPDLDLANVADQYIDIQLDMKVKPYTTPRQGLQMLCSQHESSTGKIQQREVAETLARILVCKPHSGDCERIISAYNRLKSTFRANLDCETIVHYLYINVIMPKLSNFDPRPAVLKWLTDKDRRRSDTAKVAKQQWFKTVFNDGQESCYDQPKRPPRNIRGTNKQWCKLIVFKKHLQL
jgi:hypothetical protein